MPVPKRKSSRARKNKRFANKGLLVKPIAICQTCQAPVASHQVCKQCGYYKGQKVIRTKSDRMHERTQSRQVEQSKREAMQTKAGSETKKEEKN